MQLGDLSTLPNYTDCIYPWLKSNHTAIMTSSRGGLAKCFVLIYTWRHGMDVPLVISILLVFGVLSNPAVWEAYKRPAKCEQDSSNDCLFCC